MAYVRPYPQYSAVGATSEGAQSFIRRVYTWMTVGLVVTGLTAFGVASTPGLVMAVATNRLLFYGIFAAQFGLVIALSAAAQRVGAAAAAGLFLLYSVLTGVTFSVILLAYTGTSIASTFFITGGTFAAMSLFGTVTRRDLSGWGSFLIMGLVGILIASLVNIFIGSNLIAWVVSCAGILVFTGLTAYDTQRLRALAYADGSGESPLAIVGALVLYLDFINLFLMLLNLTGDRRR